MVDIFISHAWRFHPEWLRLSQLIETKLGHLTRNFSLPWHDPAITPSSEYGRGFLTQQLFAQIQPVSLVFFLDSLFSAESNHRWLKTQYEIAKQLQKKMVVLGSSNFSKELLHASFESIEQIREEEFETYLTKIAGEASRA